MIKEKIKPKTIMRRKNKRFTYFKSLIKFYSMENLIIVIILTLKKNLLLVN